MIKTFSPTAPTKENEGYQEAVAFFTAPARQGYSAGVVLLIINQYCQRLRAAGQADKAAGFETAGLAIAQSRLGGAL